MTTCSTDVQLTESPLSALDHWCARLSQSGMPVFARTVREITAMANQADASANDLSLVVSRDASMTARLISIASSSTFNPLGRRIDTVSAAVVLLGFNAVRELSVSLALIEQVLRGRPHARVTQILARAFHAAAQAQSFAQLQEDPCPEEIFVTALFYQIGDLAFWSVDSPEALSIERLVARGVTQEDAERRVLGFPLRALSRVLAGEWGLGELLKDTLEGKESTDGRVSNIALGQAVAHAVEEHGWTSRQLQSILKRLGAHLDQPPDRIESLVKANLQEALAIARRYGVESLEAVLPVVPALGWKAEAAGDDGLTLVDGDALRASAERMLAALRDFGMALESGAGSDALMRQLLEIVHFGIGFDRTWFALLSSDRRTLQARYTLGENPHGFAGSRRALQGPLDFFQSLLDTGRAGRCQPGNKAADGNNLGWLAHGECLCMPIRLDGRAVGVLYADRGRSRTPVTDDELAQFRLLGLQIPLILTLDRRTG